MKVAFHVDQLWFSAPGGIGTYVWELLDGARRRADPSFDLVPFRSTVGPRPPSEVAAHDDGRYPGVEVPHVDPDAVPVVGPARQTRAPAALAGRAAIVHATNPAAVPPVRGDQRLVVTVHDLAFERFPELFPRDWRWLYRAGLRAAVKRADADPGPVAEHRRRSDRRRRRSPRRACT